MSIEILTYGILDSNLLVVQIIACILALARGENTIGNKDGNS